MYWPSIGTTTTGSLSTQDQAAFNRDIWVNARQIEERWRENQDELTAPQKTVLARAYDHCARTLFGVDQELYSRAAARVRMLAPSEVSRRLESYVRAEKWIGYSVSSTLERSRQKTMHYLKSILRPLYHAVWSKR